MNLTQIPIPQYDGRQGNWMAGRQGVTADTVVIHWIGGDQGSCDATFRNPARTASAHFSVEGDQVHQYVRLSDTAFHAGDWKMNLRSVGIEMSAQPGRDATDLSYETYSQLVVQVARSLGRNVAGLSFKCHRDIVNTECCGTVDMQRIIGRAYGIEADGNVPQAVPASAIPVPVREAAHSSVSALNVRSAPSTSAPVTGRFVLGQGFWYVGKVAGEGRVWLVLENGVGFVAAEYTDYNPNQTA